MKKFLIIVFFVSAKYGAFCQVPKSSDSLLLDKFLLDFTVADMPAFKALGTNPSEILRPSDVKKFALAMDAFNSNNTISIPKSFGLEVAPWKLASKRVPFSTYEKNAGYRFLYNTAFSLGTLRDSGNIASRLAVGVKFKILGKNADFISDEGRVRAAFSILQKIETIRSNMEDDWRAKNNVSLAQYSDTTTGNQKEFATYFNDSANRALRQEISNNITKFNEDNWNAGRIDAAVAWLGASPDSLVKNISYRSWQGWITFATRPAPKNHHTQLLFGLIGSLNKKITDSTRGFTWAANFRWYEGTKDLHGYLEFQAKSDSMIHNNTTHTLINLGAEIRMVQNFWIVFSAV